ncbi:MAG: S1 family peptidase [Bacillota bacterium]
MVLNRRLLLGLTSALTMAACTPRVSNSFNTDPKDVRHIVGGTVVSTTDPLSKSIVGLYIKNRVTQEIETCTGSLLPNNLVVTAAHCVSDLDGARDVVVIFSTNIDLKSFTLAQTRRVDNKVIGGWWGAKDHESLNTGDIALLHYQVTTPKGYVPATLVSDIRALSDGMQVVIAGYGATKVTKKPIDVNTYPDLIGAIQQGSVICENSIDLINCAEISMEGNGPLRQTKVTISEAVYSNSEFSVNQSRGSGSCHGDSGGPAYVVRSGRNYLVGLTSRTINDTFSDCSHQAVYTSIPFYTNWLKAAANKLLGPVTQTK